MKVDFPPIGLGTAQLGQKYGISNKTGKPTPEQAQEMLRFAWDHGVRHFDTSQEYGASEAILGTFLKSLSIDDCETTFVTTKLSRPLLSASPKKQRGAIENSCERLNLLPIDGVMLYGDDATDWYPAMAALEKCRESGLVKHLGVSVTYPREAFDALNDERVDFIQVPYNAWNASMERHGVFERAQKHEKPCFLRSTFLQGLVVAPPEQAACKLQAAHQAVYSWGHLLTELDFGSPVQVALRFAMTPSLPLVIGAETLRQLREILALSQLGALRSYAFDNIYRAMHPCENPSILDPRLWEVK